MKKENIRKLCVLISIIVGILALDLITKYVLDTSLGDETKSIIPGLFNFKLVHNYGAAWGMMAGKQIFLIVLSVVFLTIFIVYYIKEKNKTWFLSITFGFLIAGCIGNLFDRLVFGYVRDFIQFDFWKTFPIFNFADVALVVGVVMFLIYLIIYFSKQSKKQKIEDENGD